MTSLSYDRRPNGYGDYLWTGRPMVFGRRPIFSPKIENFTSTKSCLSSILYTSAKFQASWFDNNNKKKSPSRSIPLTFKCFLYHICDTVLKF